MSDVKLNTASLTAPEHGKRPLRVQPTRKEKRELLSIIDAARSHVMTEAERREQRRSFAHGNLALSNPNITRADIDRADESLPPVTAHA